MTTPADNTPLGVITDAYQDAGLNADEVDPTPEQFAKGMRRLRDLINFAQVKGLKLWVNADTTVTLTAGTATYTFGPTGTTVMAKPLRVLEGYYLYTTTQRRPLTALAWRDWLTLGQAGTGTSNQGPITQYFVDKQQTNLSVTFWLCPDTNEAANGAAHLLLQTQLTNPAALTETMNFPNEWRMWLHWGLAAELCTGQPKAVIERCEGKAAFYFDALDSWDVEDADTSFAPDPQTQTGGRSFR